MAEIVTPAITRPGEYGHGNPTKTFVDSMFVRGGGRITDNLTTLLTDFVGKEDQLKNRVTLVWVMDIGNTTGAFYQLKDKTQLGSLANGWEKLATGGGGTTSITAGTNVTITGTGTAIDPYVVNSTTPPITVDQEVIYPSTNPVSGTAVATALADKSNVGHGHYIDDIEGLNTALDNKANSSKIGDFQDLTIAGDFFNVVEVLNALDAKPSGPTTEEIQDIVGAMATDGTTVDFTYNDTNGTISAEVRAITPDHFDQTKVISFGVEPAEQAKLSTPSNWSVATSTARSEYIGTALSGNEEGQFYYDGEYWYIFIADDLPIRLGGKTLAGGLLTAGTVALASLETSVQNKIAVGNQKEIVISLNADRPSMDDWLPVTGPIANVGTLLIINNDTDVDYSPSATYPYIFESKSTGAGTPVSRTVTSTATFNTFIGDLTGSGNKQIRVTMPSNIPVNIDVVITINRYA